MKCLVFLLLIYLNFKFLTNIREESHTGRKEIGKYAVWSLSSAKPRFDVEQLRDNNLETYWQ